MQVNIFGSTWDIKTIDVNEEIASLFSADTAGFCDGTSKTICLKKLKDSELVGIGDEEELKKYILRHELIHAALIECGLGDNWVREPMGHDETSVDWLAHKFPQLIGIFMDAGAL